MVPLLQLCRICRLALAEHSIPELRQCSQQLRWQGALDDRAIREALERATLTRELAERESR